MIRFLAAAMGLLALQACTTIQDVTESRDGARYQVGAVVSARVGEVMLDRYRYSAAPTAAPVAVIPAGQGRYEVRAGYRLIGRRIDGELAYCTPIDTNFACFYDNDNDGVFDHELLTNLGVASSKRPLVPAAAYTKGEGSVAKGFKSELVYLGRSDKVINLRYLDYTDDLAQPSYSQELKFTLDEPGPTEISFRDARLRVLQADGQTIRYEVQSNFSN